MCALFLMFFSAHATAAEWAGPFYSVNVRGVQMNCASFFGEPVGIYAVYAPGVNQVGIASRTYSGSPIIQLNKAYTDTIRSDVVVQWWFAHECAHHGLNPNLNNETNADCFAVRQMVQLGLIDDYGDLEDFIYELRNLKGNARTGHLPGGVRAQNIINCALG